MWMTTSDYLKHQADLLIAAAALQRVPMDEFLRKLDEVEAAGVALDHYNRPVVTNPIHMRRVVQAAQAFTDTLQRKDVQSEHAETQPGQGQRIRA